MTTGHILLVDDEPGIARALTPALRAIGHEVTVAQDGNAAIAQMMLNSHDVVLLDLGLPDMDGKEVISKIRQRTNTPIIVISARHQEEEKIAALDVGADDYVDKPFVLGELLARVRAALRRRHGQRKTVTHFDGGWLQIDYATREVRVGGDLVKLSPKEYNLLRMLAENAGQVVTQRRLLAAGWGRSEADPQYLRVYVGMLRQKLERGQDGVSAIATEPGVGYRLVIDTVQDEA
ncbi:response regulator [Novosphingobium sp. FSY-8]|uniref:Response regulator n=1 Tax=Novosphingobium ovatum TaxID=1908523 RepID=A0ABW9XCF4_9SPHN|nr:response regulator transcription factor [Novosphingobium ovatum]NBC36208.1 response regulator [Novosphingobium ovatum]